MEAAIAPNNQAQCDIPPKARSFLKAVQLDSRERRLAELHGVVKGNGVGTLQVNTAALCAKDYPSVTLALSRD